MRFRRARKRKRTRFLKIRKMRTFRIFRFCPFEFLRKASLQLSRIWASAFHFSENTDVPDFPGVFCGRCFFGENLASFFAGAFSRWRGQSGVNPPSPRSSCPLGDWRHCRSGRVWEERTSGRHPGVGNTERWDRARRSSKKREKSQSQKIANPLDANPVCVLLKRG